MTFEPSRSQDKVLILKRISIFTTCTEDHLHFIADRTRLVEYKKGEHVYREGDPAAAFYIVSSGRLRVFSQVGGEEKTFTVLHNGDSFGEISLLTGETHSATVQALNDTLVLQIEKADFDAVINRIPSLVLYLSRQLSRRLRTKDYGVECTETTIVAVYSAARGVGRTLFATTLAASLKRETGQEVVFVDFSGGEGSRQWLYGPTGPTAEAKERWSQWTIEDSIDPLLLTHPLGFRIFPAGETLGGETVEPVVAPLLNMLSERFAYVVIDLPVEVNPPVRKALLQSDLIYLVTDPSRDHVIRTGALLHQLHSVIGTTEQRTRVILNHLERADQPLTQLEIVELLGKDMTFVLPWIATPHPLSIADLNRLLEERNTAYIVRVRRAARDLAGLLVGLALGSGAAFGLAHIGVLKVLEREKIPIDMIAGSSIGAMIGGLWACGRSTRELEEMAYRFKNPWDVQRLFVFDVGIPIFALAWGAVVGAFMGWMGGVGVGFLFGFLACLVMGLVLGPLSGGPIQGKQLMARLQQDFAGKTFDDTWIPLKIVAANPVARQEVIFDRGNIADAVRASVSIPGIFKPVMRGGYMCLDGGVVNPIPVSVLKRAGVHRIIAINVFPTASELTTHLQAREHRRRERDAEIATRGFLVRLWYWIRQEVIRSVSPFLFDVIMRSMQSMEYQIAEIACREADLTLRPTLPSSHWLEFFSPEKFIRRGEEIALEHLQELRRLTRGAEFVATPEPSVDKPSEAL